MHSAIHRRGFEATLSTFDARGNGARYWTGRLAILLAMTSQFGSRAIANHRGRTAVRHENFSMLDPAFSTKEEKETDGDRHHDQPCERIAEIPSKFRHVPGGIGFEVHSVDTRHEGHGNEDCRHDREDLHDLIHAIAHGTEIKIPKVCGQFSIGIHVVDDLNHMVIAVPKEHSCLGPDEFTFIAYEFIHHFTMGTDSASER